MSLADRLRARIEQEGPITVHAFMQAALYDAEHGYYARGRDIGERGDFYTSANVSLFAPCIRRFVDAARERLGADARMVELGGGTGALAEALGPDVIVVEPNAGMAQRQRERGLNVAASLDDLPPAPTVFLANEVLDALPVHRLLPTEDGAREGHVDWRDGAFVEVPGPLSRPELAEAARRYASFLAEGAPVEVGLESAAFLRALAKAAPRAVALFIDYGGAAQELFGASRPGGSLRGYHQHRATRWSERPGEQDMTADVDFELVEDQARDAGFDVMGRRTQGELLADLGLVEDMGAAMQGGDVSAYLAAKNLLFPGGMGERFKALCLVRGLSPAPPLPGFREMRPTFPA